MGVDVAAEVCHTRKTELQGVPVEDLSEWMVFLECVVDYAQEFLSDVGGHALAVRWVVPCDVTLSFSGAGVWLGGGWLVSELVVILAFV